ncbi:MAG: cold shock domain-containing protein [Proteobacteria bacterium]|nr:cold shock domain-containing protein [Pseudomonadota bacterium]MBU1060521.1 cold shock domain-containing protein [Pseudomonadota bacterium]
MNGTVKWFNKEKGFGFICVSGHDDYFFHVSHIQGSQLPDNGDSVTFLPEIGKKGKPVATKVTITQKASRESVTPYYGKPRYEDVYGTQAGRGTVGGAIIGTLLGGPVGAIVGGILGAVAGDSVSDGKVHHRVEITSPCLRCGGVGQVTSEVDGRFGFQCPRCKKFWSKRIEQVYEDMKNR